MRGGLDHESHLRSYTVYADLHSSWRSDANPGRSRGELVLQPMLAARDTQARQAGVPYLFGLGELRPGLHPE